MYNTILINSDYIATLNDFKILCNNPIPINITLPKSPILGTSFIIGDVLGTASANNITITPSTGLSINGAANYTLSTDYGQVKITQDADSNDQTAFASGGSGVSNINDGTMDGSTTYQDTVTSKWIENPNLIFVPSLLQLRMYCGLVFSYNSRNSNYTVIPSDYGILVDTTLNPVTITLPASPADGEVHFIKDEMGTSPLNPITISGNGHNIDGSGSFVINQPYESYTLIYNNVTTQQSLI